MIARRTFAAWKGFADTGVKPPASEADYEKLLAFVDALTSHQDINEQPWSDLFGLVAGYMHQWELANEPDLKAVQVPPYQMLAHYMEQQGVTQCQLGKEGVVDQGNLSAILRGKRGVSLELAKKLAARFRVSVEVFI